ncbi:hypothetical protein [Fibrella forsythiae]|uniref:Uncharacterized protein n=1 Tax=Fibrella forsythiae TaxID=2817061 RepID=A0ABS3JC17_9BACT|nr:hypothetical protein [Fibrella forsythiae]MBO0946996.1 hypothetical protein [Fibrella forsythiae]
MKTSTRWVMVGLAVVVLGLVAAVASATARRRSGDTTAPGTGTGSTGTTSGTTTTTQTEPCLQVSGRTVQAGEKLYSIQYTPLVMAPDSKAPIALQRLQDELVGTFTGKYKFNPAYFASGNCFIEVMPTEGNKALWVHPKHVYLKLLTA